MKIRIDKDVVTFTPEHAAEAAELARSKEGDWYLVDKEFSWTFAHTHEAQCGPYFCKR